MDIDQQRAAFEAIFPVPKNCIWCGNGYLPAEYNAWDAINYAEKFKGFQAAIEFMQRGGDQNDNRAGFEAWYADAIWGNEDFKRSLERAYQAALASPEVQALQDALERCRLALEPYDDIKPRDWKSDRENLRRAHQTACAALSGESKC